MKTANRQDYEKLKEKMINKLNNELSTATLIVNVLRFRKKWEDGVTCDDLVNELNIIKLKRSYKLIKKGTVYDTISKLNRIKELDIYIASKPGYVWVNEKQNIKKIEYRYYMPYEDYDRDNVKRILNNKLKITTWKGESLIHFEDEIMENYKQIRSIKLNNE